MKQKYHYFEIEKIGKLRKYLKLRVGSKPWRSEFSACIDHEDIADIYELWIAYPKKRKNPEYPRLINAKLGSVELVDILYSEGQDVLASATELAMSMAKKKLQNINSEYDLLKAIDNKDEDYYLFHSIEPRIIYKTYFNVRDGNLSVEDALSDAEVKLGAKLHKSEAFIELMKKQFG